MPCVMGTLPCSPCRLSYPPPHTSLCRGNRDTDGSKRKELSGLRRSCAGAVSVMKIEVHDEHPLQPILLLQISRPDGYVVEYAKAHGPLCLCVVTRWPNESKIRCLSCPETLASMSWRNPPRLCRQPRTILGTLPCRVQACLGFPFGLSYRRYVGPAVIECNLILTGQPGRHVHEVGLIHLFECPVNACQSSGILGMEIIGYVFKIDAILDNAYLHVAPILPEMTYPPPQPCRAKLLRTTLRCHRVIGERGFGCSVPFPKAWSAGRNTQKYYNQIRSKNKVQRECQAPGKLKVLRQVISFALWLDL